jgi:hypothetical protein
MASGVEQDIAFGVPQQCARHWQLDCLAVSGIGEIGAPPRPEAAAGQYVHLHDRKLFFAIGRLRLGPLRLRLN